MGLSSSTRGERCANGRMGAISAASHVRPRFGASTFPSNTGTMDSSPVWRPAAVVARPGGAAASRCAPTDDREVRCVKCASDPNVASAFQHGSKPGSGRPSNPPTANWTSCPPPPCPDDWQAAAASPRLAGATGRNDSTAGIAAVAATGCKCFRPGRASAVSPLRTDPLRSVGCRRRTPQPHAGGEPTPQPSESSA